MIYYRATIAYDGTDYAGWQIQANALTIAAVLEQSFFKVFGKVIKIIGVSRTDAGVHALGQVAVFACDGLNIDPERMRDAWNGSLDLAINIRSIVKSTEKVSPFACVVEKTYYYHIFLKRPLPMWSRFGWYFFFKDALDIDKLRACLSLYEGTHDFKAFIKIEPGDQVETVRYVRKVSLSFVRSMGAYRIAVTGPGFARYQIRRMVGYAVEVAARSKLPVSMIQDLLDGKKGAPTLLCAPPEGLCLRRIVYREPEKRSE
jgi:tRNA pseudouridine38-40 synthase